jgi:tetratricopeptide (TPR) repeat protein
MLRQRSCARVSGEFGTTIKRDFCLVHLGDYEEAIKAFDKAIEIDSQ